MNKINSLPQEIPETTSTFQIDLVGSVTKKRFLGEFVCKIPTIKDQALIAKYEAHLNGEYPVYLNSGVLKVHKQIAYLKYTIQFDDAPKFWKDSEGGYNLRDPNIIEAVYDSVLEFEEKWYREIWGEDIVNGSDPEKEA
jgi:hypothetical protein